MSVGFGFELLAEDGGARLGRMHTPHGVIDTPAFMPVGTRATVKAINQEQLEQIGAQIILGNTYHLFLRPGHELIAELGGLHRFMSWPHPILTDSGGFQVFSLSSLTRVEERGVTFRSHLDGAAHCLTPELSIEVQLALGADIIMAFDECMRYPATREAAQASMELTERWAVRSKARWEEAGRGRGVVRGDVRDGVRCSAEEGGAGAPNHNADAGGAGTSGYEQALFAIVQGGMYPDLRAACAGRLVEMDFPGYALGGLSVGEPRPLTYEIVAATMPHLPRHKPRYVMGVGTPEELVEYVGLGVDMMDCVMPTRNARNGLLFTRQGRLSIKNAAFARDPRPVDESCGCAVCARYSRAYLRHLFQADEILASCLNTWHNLFHYLDTMRRIRHAIGLGHFAAFRSEIRELAGRHGAPHGSA